MLMGQENFFTGQEHLNFNSHQKRQMHLKGQWKIQDMDPLAGQAGTDGDGLMKEELVEKEEMVGTPEAQQPSG